MVHRVLVVGLGNMGMSHALAYARIPGFEVVGVCERRNCTGPGRMTSPST